VEIHHYVICEGDQITKIVFDDIDKNIDVKTLILMGQPLLNPTIPCNFPANFEGKIWVCARISKLAQLFLGRRSFFRMT